MRVSDYPDGMKALVRVLAIGLVASMAVLVGGSATASCAEDYGPKDSPIIFVGTPTEFAGGYSLVTVEEIWRGPDLPSQVWLLTGQKHADVASSTDAHLDRGTSYVIGASKDLTTNACSIAELSDTERVGDLRPENPRQPVSDGANESEPVIPLWTVVLAAGAAGAGILAIVLRLRRRPTQ